MHLHNIHGYYVNIEMLFEWLASHRCQVKWTLHDCWAFTGHCAYEEPCCQLSTYPKTFSKRSCATSFEDKKRIFNQVPAERMTLITPSQWLADLVKQSFLSKYPVEVRHNEIDRTVFKPTRSAFREEQGLEGRFVVLGVASTWTERKGLEDFVRLSRELDGECAIVLVGLSKRQIRGLPQGVLGLGRTGSPRELAGIYTTADVFFNPTREDNYPTVNLEAEACGTPVVTYDTGGCRETVRLLGSRVISSFSEAVDAIALSLIHILGSLCEADCSPALSNALVERGAVVSDSAYIENATVERGARVGEGAIVSGIAVPAGRVVPDGVAVHGCPLEDGRWVCRACLLYTSRCV